MCSRWLARHHICLASPSLPSLTTESVEAQFWHRSLKDTLGAQPYDKRILHPTRHYISHYCNKLASSGLDDGLKMLIAARCGEMWTSA